VLAVLLSVAAVHRVSGRSGGAPLDACITLTPQHNGNLPQVTPSPHIVDLSDFNITEDEDGNMTIYYTPDTLYASKFGDVLNASYVTLVFFCSHSGSNWSGNVFRCVPGISVTRQNICR